MKKPNEVTVDMSRRRLLQGSGIALSGLVLSTWLPPLVAKAQPPRRLRQVGLVITPRRVTVPLSALAPMAWSR